MPQDKYWVEVTIITTSEAVEAVSAIFYEAGVAGLSIEDPLDVFSGNTPPGTWDYIDEKLLPKVTGEVKVKGYFSESGEITKKLDDIKAAAERLSDYGLNPGKCEVSSRVVNEADWADAWKQYYKPFRIGDKIVIKPSWEEYTSMPGDIIIEIDPGMAFGTGTHETTRMCIELLEKYVRKGMIVIDVGCGSGILSIVSSKLGASKITGVDIDEVAVKASLDNVKLSGAENVEILHGNMLDLIKDRGDIVIANIIADAVIGLSGVVPKFLKPGGLFISSGIIKDRLNDVTDAFSSNGFEIVELKTDGEWAALASTVKE